MSGLEGTCPNQATTTQLRGNRPKLTHFNAINPNTPVEKVAQVDPLQDPVIQPGQCCYRYGGEINL